MDCAEIAAFIEERLAEDEAVARRNTGAGPGWQHGLGDREGDQPAWPDYQTYDSAELTAAYEYLHRFRPLRVLRDVESARSLVAEIQAIRHYVNDDDGYPASCLDAGRCGKPCICGRDAMVGRALGILAGRWEDHPDFRPEWKP